MIGSVVRAALLATATVAQSVAQAVTPPVPSSTASAVPSTSVGAHLKEIGRIHVTTPLCKALVAGAVHAIDIETDNDGRLALAERTLATVDLDGNELLKHEGVVNLTQQFVALRAAAVEGNGIMRAFRAAAKTAPTDEQRANLRSFAEALDGALHRQKTLADDIGRLIAYLDAHPPIDKDAHDAMVFNAILEIGDSRFPRTTFDPRNDGPTGGVPEPLSVTAKSASAELVARAEPIGHDEDATAARMDPAFTGC